MKGRKDVMDEQDRAAREKLARQQRQNQNTYDPYAAPVYRNMEDTSDNNSGSDSDENYDEKELSLEANEPSVALTGLSPFRFYASESPGELLDMLSAACYNQSEQSTHEPPSVDRTTFQLTATVGDPSSPVSLQVRISKSVEQLENEESALWVVDASRGANGTPWSFLHHWREIVTAVSHMGCEGAGIAAHDKDMMSFQMPQPPPEDELLDLE
uniref:Uncharacterized protein n=2 Tax=Octactis speculum TaxID=3111310 RepID=A0A7S2B143_9STRA|mmetsp:Transcript_18240/g.24676  ORF Transcript_18240/g.24676 Transcript_18240/m.24676 type:complete len:213 (+) Transcript_18240:223-861(+)